MWCQAGARRPFEFPERTPVHPPFLKRVKWRVWVVDVGRPNQTGIAAIVFVAWNHVPPWSLGRPSARLALGDAYPSGQTIISIIVIMTILRISACQ